MKLIRFASILLLCCPVPHAKASEIRNGGDVLVIGEALKSFDEVEYSNTFIPQDEAEAWGILEAQLNKFGKKFPKSANYLSSMFKRGRITWSLVGASLKDVPDEGLTNLILTGERIQIAVNSGNFVQIYEEAWQKLNATSKAIILLHEALWIANGKCSLQSGESVRKLIAILMDKNIESYGTQNLVNTLNDIFVGDKESSPFYQMYTMEFKHRIDYRNFDPEYVYTAETDDLVLRTKLTVAGFENLLLTPLNPNPSYQKVERKNNLSYGYRNEQRSTLADLNEDLCGSLDYAELKKWRLPTTKEIDVLEKNLFSSISFFQPKRHPYLDTHSNLIYPLSFKGRDLILNSAEDRMLNASVHMRQIYKFEGEFYYFCVRNDDATNKEEK